VHNLSADTFKWALTNTAPTVGTDDELADITQIAATGGYTAGAGGGYAADGVTWTQSSNVTTLTFTDEVITASGGNVGAFRYVIFYNDTSTGDKLIGYLDYGSSITLADTETLTIDQQTSLFTLTV
jgi:hypothetical protein